MSRECGLTHPRNRRLMSGPTFALPTEPLLEAGIHAGISSPGGELEDWLHALAAEPEMSVRSGMLFGSLRKHLSDGQAQSILHCILGGAVLAQPEAILAFATLIEVHAPGEAVLSKLRECRSLHRMAERFNNRLDHEIALDADESRLLKDLAEADELLSVVYDHSLVDTTALPHPLDIGPAGICRRAFAAIVAELSARGTLPAAQIEYFVKVADLELRANEMRAGALAQSVNPYSARQVSQVMPILSAVDAQNRDLRGFLDRLAEQKRASLFHEQKMAMEEWLAPFEHSALMSLCEADPSLLTTRRIFLAIERNPLPLRNIAYFVTRIQQLGDVLMDAKLRPKSIDLPTAVYSVLEFCQDGLLRLPASEKVVKALVKADLPWLETGEFGLRVLFDPIEAQRLSLPHGLPLHVPGEAPQCEDVEQTVKDLVMDNMNNTSILLGLLKNAKVVNTPGIVSLIVMRSRSMAVMEKICQLRPLHTGFANKDVPLTILKSPMRIPLQTLRRFVNVRFVSKMDLKRLSVDRSGVRKEVVDEAIRYLNSLS